MIESEKQHIKIALLDLYNGTTNEGMRCIREIVSSFALKNNIIFAVEEFEVRYKNQIPSLDFDVYISSGGPGSPIDEQDVEWEKQYFKFIESLLNYNSNQNNTIKKDIFFICHSFQMACRFFKIGTVNKRKSTAFGVFPVHMNKEGEKEILFQGLNNPFYAVDSRDYQVVKPDVEKIASAGATILAIEKERPHVPLERAIMAVRFNKHMIGMQFHPEADVPGMIKYLHSDEKKANVIENHGEEKWKSMIEQLNDPDKILNTYSKILPNFLRQALKQKLALQINLAK